MVNRKLYVYKDPIPKDLISGAGVVNKFQTALSLQQVLLWREYQTLRYKIWGAQRCATSYWKEGQTNQY